MKIVRPAIMQPKPLGRLFPDPAFQNAVDPGRNVQNIRLLVTTWGYFQGWVTGDAKVWPLQSFDPDRNHWAFKFKCKLGQGWSAHGIVSKKWGREAVIHFLIDQHAQMASLG